VRPPSAIEYRDQSPDSKRRGARFAVLALMRGRRFGRPSMRAMLVERPSRSPCRLLEGLGRRTLRRSFTGLSTEKSRSRPRGLKIPISACGVFEGGGAGNSDPTRIRLATSALTADGTLLGTPGYPLSPERRPVVAPSTSARHVGFGGILFEMLSGRRAFSGASAADYHCRKPSRASRPGRSSRGHSRAVMDLLMPASEGCRRKQSAPQAPVPRSRRART